MLRTIGIALAGVIIAASSATATAQTMRMRGTIEKACRRAQAVGKPIGILAPIESDARAYLDMGFAYVAVGSDVVVLRKGCDALVKMFKG